MTESIDLGLRIPVRGVQLIEASAGTGKTFTLATLYARMVIELGLPVASILAVTFTEAATRELRERLRARLLLAQELVESALASELAELAFDDAADNEETRLTRQLVRAAVSRDGAGAVCRRLRLAAAQMDLAPIHTIHGFCRRALADHALEAGQPLLERELLQNEAALRREVALDFWRMQSLDAVSAATLTSIWKSPGELAESLRALVSVDLLLPVPVVDDGTRVAALDAARADLAEQFREHGDSARELLRQACAAGQVHATYVKDSAVDPVWKALREWSLAAHGRDPMHDNLGNYSSAHLKLRTRTNKKHPTPASPLFDSIERWVTASTGFEAVLRERKIAMAQAARDYAFARMAQLKRERGLLGFDDMIRGVADALDGAQGEDFAAKLREQYSIALLDEFQDTDARQWSIFRRLFAEGSQRPTDPDRPRALFLIGDPKQAIYRFRGGDVFAYLAAERHADARHRLERNFRSRPLLLEAVQALFEFLGPGAFAQAGIEFEPVSAGGRCADDHFLLDAVVAPALTLLVLEGDEKEAIEDARARAVSACVASIHALLAAGLAGRARLTDKKGGARAVEPGDIAVLVERNDDAEYMQAALSRAGIPSVAAGRSSLYDSEEAQHLCWLFEALLSPADDQRLRAALAAPLFGLDAAALAAFDEQETSHRAWQDRLQYWQQRAQRFGPMAVIGEICAEQAPRLLLLRDGERRVTNYLQLAEELQAADAHALGLPGLLSELQRRIEDADSGNDAELLRLESDAARVKILTLHMSKGLEFDFVFLPNAATGGALRHSGKPDMARFHDGTRRVAMLYPQSKGVECRQEAAEERAEKLRLLYVGLTRARLATWVVWGGVKEARRTALSWLLHRGPAGEIPDQLAQADIEQALAQLQSQAPAAIQVLPASTLLNWPRLQFDRGCESPPIALARRVLDRDWWVYSFSQLAREDGGSDTRGAEDETEPSPTLPYSRFSGTRFGNALHQALENIAMDKWLDWSTPLPPSGEFDILARALNDHGYATQADLDEGVPLLTGLISETLNVRLPDGARLAAVPEQARRNEMEFHLALAPTAMPQLLSMLHRFGIVPARQAFGLRKRIEGLLTGRIDLVYEINGRFHVVDYKSNQLRDYDAEAMAQAVLDSEYDLQYVLYTLALHRWLRFRLGDAYSPATHLGGVRYLFVRGLDRHADDAPGVHALDLPAGLIEALDALLQAEIA